MPFDLSFEIINKLIINEINLIILVENNNGFFKIIQNKFVLTLLLNFNQHIIENLHVQTGAQHLKYNEHDRSEQCREQIVVIELEHERLISFKVYPNLNAIQQTENGEEK